MAALDQRWSDQAAFGGPACAQFLKNGVILPNTQTLLPVMADGVAAAAGRTRQDPRPAIAVKIQIRGGTTPAPGLPSCGWAADEPTGTRPLFIVPPRRKSRHDY